VNEGTPIGPFACSDSKDRTAPTIYFSRYFIGVASKMIFSSGTLWDDAVKSHALIIYIFSPYLMASYFCSSNYNRLVSVSYESACRRSLPKRRSRSALCACTLPGCCTGNRRKPQQWRAWASLRHPSYLTASALSVYIRKILKLKIIFSRILHKYLGLCSSLNL